MLPLLVAVLCGLKRLLQISPTINGVSKTVENGIAGYAIYKLDADGFEYTNVGGSDATAGQQEGRWLDAGMNSEVWVERTINSGALSQSDPGAGRLQLSTDRQYGITRGAGAGEGTSTADVDFDFYDASSGGTLLLTTNVVFTVVQEGP